MKDTLTIGEATLLSLPYLKRRERRFPENAVWVVCSRVTYSHAMFSLLPQPGFCYIIAVGGKR